MMGTSLTTTLLAACCLLVEIANAQLDYNAAPPNLSTLTDTSLFETWRPRAHVLPPRGQIGDPCMMYCDPSTGLFHAGWGVSNGASGATTDDLVTYRDLNDDGAPFIVAGGLNDPLAVFDGSVVPSGINGNPTLLYTAVSYLPIQWTIAYTRGSETQALAVSADGGRNFTKLAQGPAIPAPPFAVNVTGFRDPYVFQSAQLDELLNSTRGVWYAVLSGGVHGDGPSQFLYRQYDPEFQYWEDMGQWWHEAANSTWGSGDFAGRWGFNFEVGNVFALDGRGYSEAGTTFATLGAEWSREPVVPQVSDFREMLWAAGDVHLSGDDGRARFRPGMAGKLDWGASAYAAAGKVLPSSSRASARSAAPDRFISYVWLTGNFYGTQAFPAAQNWTGSLLLPRELTLGTVDDVVDNDLVRETASWRVAGGGSSPGTVRIETMGQAIAREPLAALLAGNASTEAGRVIGAPGATAFQRSPESKFYAATANITFPASARGSDLKAGFQILSSEHESTTVYYQFSNESIVIDRTNSSAAARSSAGIDSRNEAGRLRLFDIAQDNDAVVETLQLTIVVDNAVVEVHANGRFALSTWVR